MIPVNLPITDLIIQLYFCSNLISLYIYFYVLLVGNTNFCFWPCAMGGCIRGQSINSMDAFIGLFTERPDSPILKIHKGISLSVKHTHTHTHTHTLTLTHSLSVCLLFFHCSKWNMPIVISCMQQHDKVNFLSLTAHTPAYTAGKYWDW